MSGVQASLEFDTSAAEASVDALDARLNEVTMSFGQSLADAISSVSGEQIAVDVSAVTDDLEDAVASADTEATVDVAADTGTAEADIAGLDAETVEVEVTANTEAATDAMSQLAEGSGGATDALGLLESAQAGVGASGIGLASILSGTGSAAAAGAIGVGALAAAGVTFTNAYAEAQQITEATNTLIANTGGNANITAGEIANLGLEVMGYGVASDESVGMAANFLLAMENVRNEAGAGNDVFTRAIRLGADYSAVTGDDMVGATKRFGRALNDPIRGMGLLRRAGITFTESQQAQITAMVETGDVLGAQRVLLDALEARYQGAAETFGGTVPGALGRARESFGEAAEALGEQLAPAAEGFADLMAAIAPAAAEAIGPVAELAGAIGTMLGDAQESADEGGFLSWVEGVNDAIGDQINPVQQAADAWNEMQGYLGNTAQFEVGTVIDKGTDAVDEQAGAVEDLQAAYDSMVDEAVGNLPTLADAIENVGEAGEAFGILEAESNPQAVIDNLRQMLAAFDNFTVNIATIREVSPLVAEALAPLGPEIAGTFAQSLAELPPAATRELAGVLRAARRSGVDLSDVLAGGATRGVDAAAGALSRGAGRVAGAARGAGRGAGDQFGAGAEERAGQGGARAMDAAGSGIRGNAPVREARAAATSTTQAFSQGLERMLTVARVQTTLTGGAIIAAAPISSAGSAGRQVGQSFGQGIAAGIADTISSITAAAARAVNEAEASARAAADSQSPSRLFAAVGRDLGAGIAVGLTESTTAVTGAAEALIAASAQAATPAAANTAAVVAVTAGTTSPPAGGVTVYQTIDARGANPNEVAAAVGEATTGALRRHVRADVALSQR